MNLIAGMTTKSQYCTQHTPTTSVLSCVLHLKSITTKPGSNRMQNMCEISTLRNSQEEKYLQSRNKIIREIKENIHEKKSPACEDKNMGRHPVEKEAYSQTNFSRSL